MGPALQPQDRKTFLALVAVNLPGHDMEGGRWCSRFLSKCCVSYQASACTGSLDLLAAVCFPSISQKSCHSAERNVNSIAKDAARRHKRVSRCRVRGAIAGTCFFTE